MKSILVLEDDFDLAKGWQRAFRETGYDVDLSTGSAEALAHFKVKRYDLFIVDLLINSEGQIEKDSGRRFLQHVFQRRTKFSAPVIGVTGFKPLNQERAGRSNFAIYGVKHVLFKPFPPAELVGFAETVLRQKVIKNEAPKE